MNPDKHAQRGGVFRLVQPGRHKQPRTGFFRSLAYFVSRLWSCWHRKMSRPFTRDGETYRVCLRCGMHRSFDLVNWKTTGPYYRLSESEQQVKSNTQKVLEAPKPVSGRILSLNGHAAKRRRRFGLKAHR